MSGTTARPTVVAIVAPGGYAPLPEKLAQADSLLASQGCEVRHYDDPAARHLRFAASDAQRMAGLHAAACDAEVEVIIALRGGYGISRLLQHIDFPLLAQSGKLFVGHSDLTALHMGLLVQGAGSIAGPMICDDFLRDDISDFTMTQFWSCLRGPRHMIHFAASDNAALCVKGMLWGGNLAMLVHLIGTPWMPAVDGGILFLEDINEHPFRIERMLLQLLHAGVLDRQVAVVLGDFSGGRTGDYDNGYDFGAMLSFIRSRTSVPILTGLPFGHIRDKASLAVGSSARLECVAGEATLSMQDYRTLG